jgi:hypothetical protein
MWKPHKFGPELNERFAYTKLDCSPKHFSCFKEMMDNAQKYFLANNYISLDRFTVSRVDVKADIENLPLDIVQARLFVKGLRKDSLSICKGTIYMGANPKIRIYDKTKEIRARKKKGDDLTDWEEEVFKEGRTITRFEISIKRPGLTLAELKKNPSSLVNYFDRLEFFNFEDEDALSAVGGLQMLIRNTRREFRGALEEFKDKSIKQRIRDDYLKGVATWFENKSGLINKKNDVSF